MPGGRDEVGELVVRDRVRGDPEWLDGHLAHRPLAVLREAAGVLRAHQERAAVEIDETGGRHGHRFAETIRAVSDPADVDVTRRTRLAAERTWLAWWRSGIAASATAVAVGGVVPQLVDGARTPYVLLGCGYALLALTLFVGAWAAPAAGGERSGTRRLRGRADRVGVRPDLRGVGAGARDAARDHHRVLGLPSPGRWTFGASARSCSCSSCPYRRRERPERRRRAVLARPLLSRPAARDRPTRLLHLRQLRPASGRRLRPALRGPAPPQLRAQPADGRRAAEPRLPAPRGRDRRRPGADVEVGDRPPHGRRVRAQPRARRAGRAVLRRRSEDTPVTNLPPPVYPKPVLQELKRVAVAMRAPDDVRGSGSPARHVARRRPCPQRARRSCCPRAPSPPCASPTGPGAWSDAIGGSRTMPRRSARRAAARRFEFACARSAGSSADARPHGRC